MKALIKERETEYTQVDANEPHEAAEKYAKYFYEENGSVFDIDEDDDVDVTYFVEVVDADLKHHTFEVNVFTVKRLDTRYREVS
jgi:hypothetical protein